MKKFNILLSLLLMAGLLVALPVFAAQSMGPSSSQPINNQQQMSQSQQAMNFQGFNAKDLIGKTIKDQKGNSLGKVADVVIGKDGRADFVVLSRSLLGDKYIPIPFKTFISHTTNLNNLQKASYVKVDLSKAKIDKAPTYSSRHWDLNGSQAKICSYFGSGQCYRM